jgi:hypothetical protein
MDTYATQRAVALKQPIFKRKKGFANLSLGLIYHSKALPRPPSRDTIPLKWPSHEIFGLWFFSLKNYPMANDKIII